MSLTTYIFFFFSIINPVTRKKSNHYASTITLYALTTKPYILTIKIYALTIKLDLYT